MKLINDRFDTKLNTIVFIVLGFCLFVFGIYPKLSLLISNLNIFAGFIIGSSGILLILYSIYIYLNMKNNKEIKNILKEIEKNTRGKKNVRQYN